MGGYIKIIRIAKHSFWISFSICYPHFIEGWRQFFEVVTVHKFNTRIFNKLVQRQNLELFEQRTRVGSERGIANYAYGLFLLYSLSFSRFVVFAQP